VRGDVDRGRQLRAQRAVTRRAKARKCAEFSGVPTAAIPIRHCRCSFFDSRTRATRVSLTLRASATGCAPVFLRSESHRALIARILAGRIISRHRSIFNDQTPISNCNLNHLQRCSPGANTCTDRLRHCLRCCRSARASPSPNRNRENVTTTGERSANLAGKGEPCWKSTASGSRCFTECISFAR
jgi:hypothetical protein